MIYVLLPAYNEEDALEPLLRKIDAVMAELRTEYAVVVVDDGSKDRTPEILRTLEQRYPVRVIRHKYNRGLGETARDGFEYIAEHGQRHDVAVRMDCDDTHDPAYIKAMVAKLAEGWEVVTTSRYAPGGGAMGLDWYRRFMSRTANLMFKTVFPIPNVWEYTCGYRAYRVAVVQDALAIFGNKFIDLKGLGFTGTLEKLIKFRMMGARICEIPFVLRYDMKMSASKVIASITTLGCFVLMIKHSRYWNTEGQRWKTAIEERRRRVYGEGGHLLASEPLAVGTLADRA
jgi:dolichol-phosphate mannosyltransferase